MFVKFITCHVPKEKVANFHHAQKQWDNVKRVNGFVRQIGGWVKENDTLIRSFWETKMEYEKFMNDIHDLIVSENNQEKTYTKIEVELFEDNSLNDTACLFPFTFIHVKHGKNTVKTDFDTLQLYSQKSNIKDKRFQIEEDWDVKQYTKR
jgi:hypothetical protein